MTFYDPNAWIPDLEYGTAWQQADIGYLALRQQGQDFATTLARSSSFFQRSPLFQNIPAVSVPTPLAKHVIWNFDTIGQTIFRFIGHCRLPLRIIWAAGIEESGDDTVSPTQTFAAALGMPLDPEEEGEIFSLYHSNNLILNEDGIAVAPLGWNEANTALLALSLANMTIYPGDEAQLPDPLIVADKGANLTNAFRGMRYIVFPDYPIFGGDDDGVSGGSGTPNLSVVVRRTSAGEEPEDEDSEAAEFLDGSD